MVPHTRTTGNWRVGSVIWAKASELVSAPVGASTRLETIDAASQTR